jgi:hypothetical protein
MDDPAALAAFATFDEERANLITAQALPLG